MRTTIKIALATWLTICLACGDVLAGRGGGGRGGGGRGGGFGGGGFRPAGGGMPSFNRTPSFNMPAARPQMPAARPQMPSFNMPAARPNLPQRPVTLPGPATANRPQIPTGGGRPNLPGNIGQGNRPGLGAGSRPGPGNNPGTIMNRPGTGNVINRPNSGNNININNVNNNFNNWNNHNRPGWADGRPAWSYRPGWNYHQGWVNGYWHGQNNGNWWNNWGGFATGLAIGGIGAWGIGSSLWNWGYMPYSNPYYSAPAVVTQPVLVNQPAAAPAYDYSQPLTTEAPPPDEAVADPAIQTFDAARASFLAGNYTEALKQTDEALKTLPSDAALHEFRALCLFALGQYDQAAATLYAVLSAGPGWDWTTLVRLYPSVDVYTAQLRALEAYAGEHPSSAPARFVLAYHYLTQGHTESAVEQLKQVVQLQPSDRLSAQLVTQLSGDAGKTQAQEAGAPPAAPTEPTASSPGVPEGNLVGTWKASPAPATTIELTTTADGNFKWNVIDQGKSRPIEGKYTYGNGILAMSQNENNSLVGKVTWQDENHFKFQAMGGPNDPGLVFSR
jgi:tetratricopeptide (TPR) repeat protein